MSARERSIDGLRVAGALGAGAAADACRAATDAGAGASSAWLVEALGVALAVAIGVAAVLWRRVVAERAARLAAERVLADGRLAREAAEARRARHCAAMGREASASLESLNGAMRLLDAARPEPGVRLHLATVRRAASALAAQLAHAIDYDAIERGQVRVRPQRTDVLALVREVASQSAVDAADRRVAFSLFAPQHPIPAMHVDPARLRQVADALVRDAIARVDRGDVRVELRWEREAAGSEAGWLLLKVIDDGPDPAPGVAARLQAALEGDVPEPARDLGGVDSDAVVGVAMWRAARITKALGGSLHLLASPGAGVHRDLRLPVRFDAVAAERGSLLEDLNAGFARPTLAAGGATRGGLLLVEDDRVVQFTLEQQLSRLGWDVACADDAEEALDAWLRAPTRWVLTDLGLPGRDGVALITAIRDAERANGWPPCWIVVLTGEPAHEGRSRAAGADRVLLKPATPEHLARALQDGEAVARTTGQAARS